jgi:hypothetical protein
MAAVDNTAKQEDMLAKQQAMQDRQFELSMRMTQINMEGDTNKQLAAGLSNAEKSGHDAMMAIIQNMK